MLIKVETKEPYNSISFHQLLRGKYEIVYHIGSEYKKKTLDTYEDAEIFYESKVKKMNQGE